MGVVRLPRVVRRPRVVRAAGRVAVARAVRSVGAGRVVRPRPHARGLRDAHRNPGGQARVHGRLGRREGLVRGQDGEDGEHEAIHGGGGGFASLAGWCAAGSALKMGLRRCREGELGR